jgi:hypothetical protein
MTREEERRIADRVRDACDRKESIAPAKGPAKTWRPA